MTPELTVLALAALLQAVQILLFGAAATKVTGLGYNASPRDTPPPPMPPRVGRLQRALNNHFEALAFFTIAVVVVTLSGQSGGLTAALAWIYLAARVLYIPAYALGWVPWRSVIWGVGFSATLIMILAALI
ncbi:MAPEG family protein [Halodurantibacterium flavum]|uniref:MAPEG family protein n=1 Tax=Halodurantibacterium flavum TaxID=1382802 RepID=A0ABW4S2T8_9RHOB